MRSPMSALDLVRGGGRSLDRRLARVSGAALLAGLRAAGAVSEPEAAALGRPDSGGWTRRLRALAAAKGEWTCRTLLAVLEGLEGPPPPGPFDFFDPHRDSAPAHRSDCPCCRTEPWPEPRPEPEWTPREEEEEGAGAGEEGPEEEEEEGEAENEEKTAKNGEREGEDEEGEAGNGDEGPEDEEEEPKNGDEGPDDDDDGGGDEDDDGGGDEGPQW
ncbi:uncharacterized protein LOC141731728 isoform X2 [Zonotrichia albicollis]|uniref:uncharacterized protein LOC141731728 isoform X2 n=1 Tax=Zonotrichia albicollis TaxID=44394 RepID=UPI003D80EBEF